MKKRKVILCLLLVIMVLQAPIMYVVNAEENDVSQTCTVTFDSKDGSKIDPIQVKAGDTITLPTNNPTRSDDTFVGWYTDEACTTAFDVSTKINANITLYAKWDAVTILGLEAYYTGQNLVVGTTINKSDITVTVRYSNGKSQVLQAYQFEISKDTVSLGTNTIEVSYSTLTATVSIFGVEDTRIFTVTFDSQDGSTVAPIKNIKYGDIITFPKPPTRNGYFFSGWYTQKACLTKFSEDTEIIENTTLYAKWVTLLSDPKSTIKSVSATYTGSSILVGSSISKSSVTVIVTDLNDAKHTVTDFTIEDYQVKKSGDNTLTIKYGGSSATFTVKGITTEGNTATNTTYVTFISAAYIGGTVEVGSSIDKNNITVIAAYNDNSIEYATDFSLSSSVVNSLGTNTITVYYGGYTATITITGVAKGSLTPTTPTQSTSSTTVISGTSAISTSVITGGYQGVVFPKVSLTTDTNFSTITAEIEEKVLASAIAGKDIGNRNVFQLTLSGISSQILTQLNRSNVNEVYVNICMPVQYYGRNDIQISNISLDNATLNRIKTSSKSVIIQYVGSSYSTETGKTHYTNPLCILTMKGKEFNATADSNVALRVAALDKEYQIESVVNQYLKSADRGIGSVVTLEQNGELDKFASIIVDVGNSLSKEKGDIVYVYGYNATTKKLEELPATKYTVDKNQDITIPVSTYSKYIILPDATNTAVTSLASRAKVSKSLTMAKGKGKQITITLPSQISDSSVKVTYKSSNTKVASVSKTGEVTGKKKGKTVITTTITYGSTSKKFTTPITVK